MTISTIKNLQNAANLTQTLQTAKKQLNEQENVLWNLASSNSENADIVVLSQNAKTMEEDITMLETKISELKLSTEKINKVAAKSDKTSGINISTAELEGLSLDELNELLTEVNKQIDNWQKEFTKYESERKILDSQQKAAEADKNKKESDYNTKVKTMNKEQNKLTVLTNSYNNIEDELNDLNDTIKSTQKSEKEASQDRIDTLVKQAIDNYDEDKHGDNFSQYLTNILLNANINSTSSLNSLNSAAVSLQNIAKGISNTIALQSTAVQTAVEYANNAQIEFLDAKTRLESANAKVSENAEVLSGISVQLNGAKAQKTKVTNQITIKEEEEAAKAELEENEEIDTNEKTSTQATQPEQATLNNTNKFSNWTELFKLTMSNILTTANNNNDVVYNNENEYVKFTPQAVNLSQVDAYQGSVDVSGLINLAVSSTSTPPKKEKKKVA